MPRVTLFTLALLLTALPTLVRAGDESLTHSLACQLSLERAGFSPGLIDGRPGPKTTLALAEYQHSRHLPSSAWPDLPSTPLATYTIPANNENDITGVTTDWNARAAMPYLGYESLLDLLAEKFHTSQRCLTSLNPNVDFNRAPVGTVITVPNVEPAPTPRAARLEINLAQKAIRAFDSNDKVIALFHCSIAANVAKRPSGEAQVTAVAVNPNYTFDPAMWPDVHNVTTKLTIPPGPRNPVGLAWISLSLPGYGMHGTPHPDQIGKTGSHGCFRLANWDAVRLSKMVRTGMTVTFISDGAAVAGAQ